MRVRAILRVKCGQPGCVEVIRADFEGNGWAIYSAYPRVGKDGDTQDEYRFYSCDDDATHRIRRALQHLIQLSGGSDELF